MSTRDELEAALRVAWNPADLAVYADHLQALGDPRGELIALDLRPAPADHGWRHRRESLLVDWLGPELAARAGHRVQHGVVHELRAPRDLALLQTPLGDVARSFTTWSKHYSGERSHTALIAALELLAERRRPWLSRLAIGYYHHAAPCSAQLRDALVTATPNLVELFAFGHRAFDAFHHPSLRTLHVTPLFQQPPTGVPDTNAAVVEIMDDPLTGPQIVEREQIGTVLEAIELAPDVNDLYATYGDLAGAPDSLPAMLVRMDEAGLVVLDGPTVRLSEVGHALLRWPIVGDRRGPSRVPPSDSKWVLWIDSGESGEDRDLLIAGLLRLHVELLDAALDTFPVSDTTHRNVCHYVDFLDDVVEAGEWTNVTYAGPLDILVDALAVLGTFHRLEDFDLHPFAPFGDTTTWSYFDQIVTTLRSIQRKERTPRFRVAWGF